MSPADDRTPSRADRARRLSVTWATPVIVLLAVADVWWNAEDTGAYETTCAALACAALALRRRFPLTVFLTGVPATLFLPLMVVPFASLYALAATSRSRPLLAACALISATADAAPWPLGVYADDGATRTLVDFAYLIATAAAPVFLGQLVQARQDAAERLREVEEARDHERQLHAQNMLARERAQLAREMHDVVSHQVSLIAIQAGALQVSATEPRAKAAAHTIRELSVTTLDELRHMVLLLRMFGGDASELAPQPTLADLRRLVDGSGVHSTLSGELPADLPAPVQRTLYRTVQEALTNARKHAPGSRVTVQLWHDRDHIGVTVTNTPPSRPATPLPGAHLGLIGLRERADLLHGRFESAPTTEGGFTVRLTLPYGTDA
ncbi:sensor histidine kinase [Streptomyces flavofungini]|uniref:sensor histidine kinase n=1 Tax=Streptomyces flavofungini TaxID=68200 RepID=UPI0025AF0EE7|nr:histidine kinase [Streptomyces flavofungini]WJV51013.1 histidine kinase [Streptomyces flavofungini]